MSLAGTASQAPYALFPFMTQADRSLFASSSHGVRSALRKTGYLPDCSYLLDDDGMGCWNSSNWVRGRDPTLRSTVSRDCTDWCSRRLRRVLRALDAGGFVAVSDGVRSVALPTAVTGSFFAVEGDQVRKLVDLAQKFSPTQGGSQQARLVVSGVAPDFSLAFPITAEALVEEAVRSVPIDSFVQDAEALGRTGTLRIMWRVKFTSGERVLGPPPPEAAGVYVLADDHAQWLKLGPWRADSLRGGTLQGLSTALGNQVHEYSLAV